MNDNRNAAGGSIKDVRIVVAPRNKLEELCEGGKVHATDILIDEDSSENAPFQCPGNRLRAHDPHDARTLVFLSFTRQESVRWHSETAFSIKSVGLHHGDNSGGRVADNPFWKLHLPTAPGTSVESGPIVPQAINHQYKITLMIGEREIDPDVWCSI